MPRRKNTEFKRLRLKHFISPMQIMRLFNVSRRTVWIWDHRKAPAYAVRELARQDRQLGGLHPDWRGWRMGWDGALYGPGHIRVNEEHLRLWARTMASLQPIK